MVASSIRRTLKKPMGGSSRRFGVGSKVKVKGMDPQSPKIQLISRNPANSPVEVGSFVFSCLLQGFMHLRWLFEISEPSTV